MACPIPTEKLTKNTPDYKETYSFGENIQGCRYNEVYSLSNYVRMLGEQDMAFVLRPKDLPIPIFTWEKPVRAARLFTICSLKAMCDLIRSSGRRFFYYHITQMDPCHFYMDFDLSYDDVHPDYAGKRCVNGAIAEGLECVDVAIAHQRDEAKNAAFAGVTGYTISRLDANKPGKESTHLVLHFNGLHMFENYLHAQYFCALVLHISNTRHPERKDNPNYYFHRKSQTFRSILDFSVFSINRNWRCVGCYKNREDTAKIAGPLYPPCGTTKLICDILGCPYHTSKCFSDAEFLENSPTFVPRDLATGEPRPIKFLTLPKYEMPDLRRSGGPQPAGRGQGRITTFMGGGDSSMGGGSGNNSRSTMAMYTPTTSTLGFATGEENVFAERRHIFSLIARMLSKIKGTDVVYRRLVSDEFARLASNSDHECVYKYKLEHMGYTPAAGEVLRTEPHDSNHIHYYARIHLPAPAIYVHCTSLNCKKFINDLQGENYRNSVGFAIQTVDVDVEGNEELMALYRTLVRAYMLKQVFPDDLLTGKK